jgi:hypothetical protein
MDAPYMLNLKWRTTSGHDASLTITGEDLTTLINLTGDAAKKLNLDLDVTHDESQAYGQRPAKQPARQQARPPAPQPARQPARQQAGGPNGQHANGQNGQSPGGPLCAIHHQPMRQRTNARGSWFSHKDDFGNWCSGAK